MAEELLNIEALRPMAPARRIAVVTPSDSVDLPFGACDSLYAKTAGNVTFTARDGGTDTWSVYAGQIIPVQTIRVLATGTTAAVTAFY